MIYSLGRLLLNGDCGDIDVNIMVINYKERKELEAGLSRQPCEFPHITIN
jgi:hypothetical protein